MQSLFYRAQISYHTVHKSGYLYQYQYVVLVSAFVQRADEDKTADLG